MTRNFCLDGTQMTPFTSSKTELKRRSHLGLDTSELFGECSHLKVNVKKKTKAVWLGSKSFSKDILLPEKHLAWVFNEPFDTLGPGITFFVETQRIAEHNYKKEPDEVRQL